MNSTLDDLIVAIEVRMEWNQKPFKEVVKAVEWHLDKKFSEKELEEWRFTGLNNVDFIILKIGVDVGKK